MVGRIANYLGQGIYTPSEAAFYARERTQTVSAWIMGSKSRKAVIHRQFENEERFVSFLEFVQTLAIASIRRQYGVPLQTIRVAVNEARTRYGVEYPFAMHHTTHLFQRVSAQTAASEQNSPLDEESEDAGRKFELFIKLKNQPFAQLTGRHRGNYAIKEVVELYLQDVSFGKNGLAEEYRAWSRFGLEIKMNPKKRFGEPLTPSGYTAQTLWQAVISEGSIELAAKAYGVARKEVELAFSYVDSLKVPRRAE
jgi:hypothetical protein